MKYGFFIVATILASAFVSELLLKDSGYIAIYYQNYVIEMSLLIFLLVFFLVIILLFFVKKIFGTPNLIFKKTNLYKKRNANDLLEQSYLMMARGNYKKAEKYAKNSLKYSDTPLVAYLQGAIAADKQNLQKKRDAWISNAYENHPKGNEAILLLQAKFQLSDRNFEGASTTLNKIKKINNNSIETLNLLKNLYIELKDWQKILDILPSLRKFETSNISSLEKIESIAYIHIMNTTNDTKKLNQIWSRAPKTLKNNVEFTKVYCQRLITDNQEDLASKTITSFLNKDYDYTLVSMYSQMNIDNAEISQKNIMRWMKTHGKRDELLIAAAAICNKEKLWGQASRYLEESISISPSSEALFKLGEVLSHLEKTKAGNFAFERALKIQSNLEMNNQI